MVLYVSQLKQRFDVSREPIILLFRVTNGSADLSISKLCVLTERF